MPLLKHKPSEIIDLRYGKTGGISNIEVAVAGELLGKLINDLCFFFSGHVLLS